MVVVNQMAQFMDNDILNAPPWRLDQFGIENDVVLYRAASPTLRHFSQDKIVWLHTVSFESFYPIIGIETKS